MRECQSCGEPYPADTEGSRCNECGGVVVDQAAVLAVLAALEERVVLGACDCGGCAEDLVVALDGAGWKIVRKVAV